MKLTAFLFFCILAFLTLQPAFNFQQLCITEVEDCCEEATCTMSNEELPVDQECEKQGCNPFMSCVYGNFFLLSKSSYQFPDLTLISQKMETVNDNRVATYLSDCFHPPEA
jgi:hypothetical protein